MSNRNLRGIAARIAPDRNAATAGSERIRHRRSTQLRSRNLHLRIPAGPSRGRRRRGGRGRGGRGREQAVAQAFAPAAVKGSIPVRREPAEEAADAGSVGSGKSEGDLSTSRRSANSGGSRCRSAPAERYRCSRDRTAGIGKSSWFKRHNVVPLSSDMMRSLAV